jgi:ATP-binding cassette subfamily F protein 3
VKLLLDPPNLLLMDEPTTHLDVGSIDALVGALEQYEGTLIFISHDVYFIREVAKTVLHISAGKLTPYAGDYDYYLDKSRATSARAALTVGGEKLHNLQPKSAPTAASSSTPPGGLKESRQQRRADAEQRKADAKVKRDQEKRARELEMHILSLEGRQRELTAELEKPETYAAGGAAMELNRELLGVTDELTRATKEWEALAETSESVSAS